ncbi:hypothetical protein GCM10010145_22760 [Streptomyces ruber]|uniref:Uncharacterized protein n=2 Tax=Streptomyces TaxID=1883 RepID=A0A918BAM5_9ACTN|nr:hypothetical protein GCM10010145_22760 [Streptomyces ruber]
MPASAQTPGVAVDLGEELGDVGRSHLCAQGLVHQGISKRNMQDRAMWGYVPEEYPRHSAPATRVPNC